MNAPQKPSSRQVPRQKPVALPSPALELTPVEVAVIMAFRQLNNRGQVSGKPAALYPSSVQVGTISAMFNTMEIGHGWDGRKTIT